MILLLFGKASKLGCCILYLLIKISDHSLLYLGIPISFNDELDVSAKTTNGEMFINTQLSIFEHLVEVTQGPGPPNPGPGFLGPGPRFFWPHDDSVFSWRRGDPPGRTVITPVYYALGAL